jgi:hypothetical protein
MSYDFIIDDTEESNTPPSATGWETVRFQIADETAVEAPFVIDDGLTEDLCTGLEEFLVALYF